MKLTLCYPYYGASLANCLAETEMKVRSTYFVLKSVGDIPLRCRSNMTSARDLRTSAEGVVFQIIV